MKINGYNTVDEKITY